MLLWQPDGTARYETKGANTGATSGSPVTAAGSANTKGSWTNIATATGFAYQMLIVSASAGGNNSDFIFDIGISDGSNRWVLAADLRCAARKANRAGGMFLMLPLSVPAGSQLSVRTASTTASDVLQVVLIGCSTGLMGAPGYSRMVALYTSATSRGVDIDPTAVDTKTTWVELIAATSQRIDALMLSIGHGAETTRTVNQYYLIDVATGAAASEQVLVANMLAAVDSTGDTPHPQYYGPMPTALPSGSRLAVRLQSDDVTAGARKLDLAAWGFVT